MAKKVKKKISPQDLGGGGLKRAKQILEDKIEYQTLKGIAEEGEETATATENPSQTQPVNPEVINQYTEYLNSLPEEQRGIAMQLIATMHQGGSSGSNMGMKMDPMMLMLMNMMGNQNPGNNDDATVKMMENQNNVLIELIKNQGNNNNNDALVELIKAMNDNNNNNESTSELIKAVNEMNSGNDKDRELLNQMLMSLIQNSGGDDMDAVVEKLGKMREAGLITDPNMLFQVKKLEADKNHEQYKIDKDYEIEKMKIDKDREQTDKASEFLSDIANTIQNLNEGGEGEGKSESESEGAPPQQVELNYPCPSCETPVTISPQTEDGAVVKCPGCEGNIRVKRKQKQEA